MQKLFVLFSTIIFLLVASYIYFNPPTAKTESKKALKIETKATEINTMKVKLETTLGDIIVQLDTEKAPITTSNFRGYVEDGYYDGTIFHRVIKNFMAQGGGFTTDFQQKPTKGPIKNEADNGLKNMRGTLAMARTADPNSATSQFFINYSDNSFLDYSNPTTQGWGYAVFGKVVEGMDVVDKMATIPTGSGGSFPTDVPQTEVVINKATVIAE